MDKKYISYLIKGIIVGGSMLIPGVSGGTMAITLGIYDELIASVNSVLDRKTTKLLTLIAVAIGGLLGILLFAKPIEYLTQAFEDPTMYFFIGAVVGGLPIMVKKANQTQEDKKKGFGLDSLLYIAIGFLILFLISQIPAGTFEFQAGIGGYLLLVVTGIIAAVALVLPGISVSYMFLVLGMYNVLLNAITSFNLAYLAPLGIGLLLGVALTTKILEKCMTQFPRPTYYIIIGFIFASIVEAFPGIPSGIQLLICPALFIVGFGIIYMLSLKEEE